MRWRRRWITCYFLSFQTLFILAEWRLYSIFFLKYWVKLRNSILFHYIYWEEICWDLIELLRKSWRFVISWEWTSFCLFWFTCILMKLLLLIYLWLNKILFWINSRVIMMMMIRMLIFWRCFLLIVERGLFWLFLLLLLWLLFESNIALIQTITFIRLYYVIFVCFCISFYHRYWKHFAVARAYYIIINACTLLAWAWISSSLILRLLRLHILVNNGSGATSFIFLSHNRCNITWIPSKA